MSLLGIWKSTSNEVVLAELGHYPLQIHFWQQILNYHQWTFGLDDTRLVSLAMMDGLTFSAGTAGVDEGAEWHEQLNSFLIKHNLSVFHKLHVEAIIDRAKLQHVEQFSSNSTSCSIIVYRTLQPEHRYAEYLSSVSCFQIEGCLAGLDVGAMVCMLTQGDGWILKGRTGCVRCATHLGTWKMSSISCLVAQLTVMLDKKACQSFSAGLYCLRLFHKV